MYFYEITSNNLILKIRSSSPFLSLSHNNCPILIRYYSQAVSIYNSFIIDNLI